MSSITMHVLDAQDTATALRRRLGNARGWSDFLADCIRGLTTFEGLTLVPVCYTRDRCRRPVYALRDVVEFVTEAAERIQPSDDPAALRPFKVELPAEALCLPFRMRTGAKVPELAPSP